MAAAVASSAVASGDGSADCSGAREGSLSCSQDHTYPHTLVVDSEASAAL
jgi:hypothetical protein